MINYIAEEVISKEQSELTNNLETPASLALMQMITASFISQAIYIAAELSIADLLKDNPKTVDELAEATGSKATNLYRVLRALASVGIFSEVTPKKFALTETAKYLQTDIHGSLRSLAMMMGDSWHWHCWGDILNVVKTGQPALQKLYQVNNAFEYLAQNPVSQAIFNDTMTSYNQSFVNPAIVESYNFQDINNLVDIGGGHGSLIASILKSNQHLNGVLFDLPSVVINANKLLVDEQVSNRCKISAGDFFTSVPAGGDAYILSRVIHDWDDYHAAKILSNIRQVISKTGKLLLAETVIPEANAPHFSKLLDIELMMAFPPGQERTKEEYEKLLQSAGFQLTQVISTDFAVSIIEAMPI